MKAKLKIEVSGLHCASCALTIDDAVEEIAGVARSKTSVARGRTKVDYDDRVATPEQIRDAIASVGYRPHA